MVVYGKWNQRSPFWWEGPDGSRVLSWYSLHYHQWRSLFGATPSVEPVYGSLQIFLNLYERRDYQPDAFLVFGTDVDNVTASFLDAEFVENWNKKWAYPQIVPCRFTDFFQYVDKNFGSSFPVVRGEGGGYWEDGVGTMAQATSLYRQTQTRALAAESLGTLTSFPDRRLRYARELGQSIWRNLLLYGEHTITSYRGPLQPAHDESVEQTRVKAGRAELASRSADDLMRLALSQLGELIPTQGENLVVYNPLSWARDGLVRFQLEEGLSISDLGTSRSVDFEVLDVQQGYRTIRFWAEGVPSLGNKIYRIAPGSADVLSTRPAENAVMENQFYRVTLDAAQGAVSSIIDKELGCELVDCSGPYRLNEYLYVDGGGSESGRGEGREATQLTHLAQTLPFARLEIHPSRDGRIVFV
jgi:alpha-mannosidase